jgi:hypothetical protein
MGRRLVLDWVADGLGHRNNNPQRNAGWFYPQWRVHHV